MRSQRHGDKSQSRLKHFSALSNPGIDVTAIIAANAVQIERRVALVEESRVVVAMPLVEQVNALAKAWGGRLVRR